MSTPEERTDELRREMPTPRKHPADPDYMEEPPAAEKIAQAEAFMDELCGDAEDDTTIDDDWLVERERLEKAATAGPWRVAHWHPLWVESMGASEVIDVAHCPGADGAAPNADATFIADARTAVPALVAEVRRLRHEGATIRLALEIRDLTIGALLDVNAMRVKRCHYCDAPMREKELVRDGAVVGMQYRCSGGCP